MGRLASRQLLETYNVRGLKCAGKKTRIVVCRLVYFITRVSADNDDLFLVICLLYLRVGGLVSLGRITR